MKISTYHVSNFGSFAPRGVYQENGFVTYHDSPRYAKATVDKLNEWAESEKSAIRNAALTQKAERILAAWQCNNS